MFVRIQLATLAFLTSASFLALATGCSSSADAPQDAGLAHEAATSHDAAPKHDAGIQDAPSLDGWTVASGCNPLAVTSECILPYPSDLMTVADPTTPTGLRVALPPGALTVPDAEAPINMAPFNRGDGAPTSEAIVVHFGVEVGASFLADDSQTASSVLATSPIALLNETTGERMPFLSEMDANSPTATGRHALIIRPLTPLAFGTKYVVVITSAVRDASGKALPVSKGFVALRDKIHTEVPALEAARCHFEQLFTVLAAHGYARDSLALAWDYTTASSHSVIGPITTMRQQVFHATTRAAPVLADGGADAHVDASTPALDAGGDAGTNVITYSISSVAPAQYLSGGTVVEGSFTPPNYLKADNTIDYGTDNVPALQTTIPAPSYPFTMVIPSQSATQSLPLVVIGHGAGSDGRTYLAGSEASALQPLAGDIGAVLIATDWIGLSSEDLPIIGGIASDLNAVGELSDRLLQAIVNNLSMIELSVGALEADPQVRRSTAQPFIDPTRIYYMGLSLGGIEGSSLISVSRNITRGVMIVPGASWSTIGERSHDFLELFGAVSLAYPDPLFQLEFFSLTQSRWDPADPINLATLFSTNPLPDSPTSRIVVLEEGIDDCVVPNLATEMLARAYGLPLATPDIVPIYGVPTVANPANKSALSQFKILSDVASYTPPTSDVPPPTDNGVHEDMAAQGPVIAEALTLLTTGSIVQTCDAGPCLLH